MSILDLCKNSIEPEAATALGFFVLCLGFMEGYFGEGRGKIRLGYLQYSARAAIFFSV